MRAKVRLIVVTALVINSLLGLYTWQVAADKASFRQQSVSAFSKATLKVGSQGADVIELQGRLKHLGFYSGKVDGKFGWTTRNAVTWFQWKFGLKADGIVAGPTKLKLWKATKSYKPGAKTAPKVVKKPAAKPVKKAQPTKVGAKGNRAGLSENELRIIANAVHGEARGELYVGQVAVAAVILNRLQHPQFPHTVSGVIFQPGAFTAVDDGQIWLTPNETAHQAALDAANGWDPTGGAIYYFNPVTATSKWIWSRPQIKTIGKHVFCM